MAPVWGIISGPARVAWLVCVIGGLGDTK
jgi:hypothetical protein